MITLYLIFKMTELIFKLVIWLVLLPFRIIFFPFSLLFGKRGGSNRRDNDDGFWDGLLIGSIFF